MEKTCSISECSSDPIGYCGCRSPRSYLCKTHFDVHLLTKDKHKVEKLSLDLKGQVRKDFSSVLENYRHKLSKTREFYSNLSLKIIEQLSKLSSQIMSLISKSEESLENLAKKITESGSVNRKTLEYLILKSSFDLPVLSDTLSSVLDKLQPLYDAPYLKDDPIPDTLNKEFLLFFDENSFGFYNIDLITLNATVERLPSLFNSVYFNAGCLIDDGCFFLNGGRTKGSHTSAACVYNAHLRRAVHMEKSNFIRECGACVAKEQQVYVFGEGTTALGSCEKFDLQSSQWQVLPNMPETIANCSGALVADNIIISGLNTSSFWIFDEELNRYLTYKFVLPRGYKVICDNFIVTCDGLFEIRDTECIDNWDIKRYEYMWLGSPLAINMSVRVKDKIYFVDARKKLLRVNARKKTVEEVRYTVNS